MCDRGTARRSMLYNYITKGISSSFSVTQRSRMPPLRSFALPRLLGLALLACPFLPVSGARSDDAGAGGYYRRYADAAFARARTDPETRAALDLILKEARRVARQPVVERPRSLEELRNPGDRRIGNIDTRTPRVERASAEKANLFALSQADVTVADLIARELPLMAAAYRVTGDPVLKERIVRQLEEVAGWNPFQRRGWTLYTPENDLPPGGEDGVWLATGLVLTALTQTFALLPENTLPEDLRARLLAACARETAQVRHDWENRVPWYVRSRRSITNQWVVPAAGQVAAAAMLGRDRHAEDYECGVRNLLVSLDDLGEEGATSEGSIYAIHWTAPFLYLAARAAAEAGDRRLIDHPFLQRYPRWQALAFQPGGSMVNAFDAFDAQRGNRPRWGFDVYRLATLSGDPELNWIARRELGPEAMPLDQYGLFSLSIGPGQMREPPRWALYQRGHWAVWRDSWNQNASGVWIRGGDRLDFHDHNDRGHVNFIVGGRVVLMESGTPPYSDPAKATYFDTVAGHNVLQVGDELTPKRAPAPITVHRLDERGGEVVVEAGAGYQQVRRWTRRVSWTSREMIVVDEVELSAPDRIRFRWHLASEEELRPDVTQPAKQLRVHLPEGELSFPRWIGGHPLVAEQNSDGREHLPTPEVEITLAADHPVQVSQERALNHTLKFRKWEHRHTCMIVDTSAPTSSLRLTTTIRVP